MNIMLTIPRRHLRSHWWPGRHQSDGGELATEDSWATASVLLGCFHFPGQLTQITLMTRSITSSVFSYFRILYLSQLVFSPLNPSASKKHVSTSLVLRVIFLFLFFCGLSYNCFSDCNQGNKVSCRWTGSLEAGCRLHKERHIFAATLWGPAER